MGTIPANTGKMLPMYTKPMPYRDHPREYGENLKGELTGFRDEGPSPRIPGKLLSVGGGALDPGTIPANTGRILVIL